jgi:DnaJ-class molecular chaperone
MAETFYDVLGVNESSSQDEIKRAWRSLQLKYHPDRNSGLPEAESMTRKINEAYETLGDEQKRKEYDFQRNNTNPFTRMNSHGPNHGPDIDDIINMMFGGGNLFNFPGHHPQHGGATFQVFHNGVPVNTNPGMQGMPGMPFMRFHNMGQQHFEKPSPIVKHITINMEQVLNGSTIPIEIERWILENGNKVFENETIYINIPKGIDEGEMIVVPDKGHVINDDTKGDIKISIKIENDTMFKRSGLDLIIEKTIQLKESLCGFSFEIKYINGKTYTLNNVRGNIIPPEYRKIYPNMGLERDEHKGNMIIHFHVEFPEQLTEGQIVKIMDAL